eukprot:SAG11_NODE_6013_length_1410_cov_0.980168_1_plen_81_part_00
MFRSKSRTSRFVIGEPVTQPRRLNSKRPAFSTHRPPDVIAQRRTTQRSARRTVQRAVVRAAEERRSLGLGRGLELRVERM